MSSPVSINSLANGIRVVVEAPANAGSTPLLHAFDTLPTASDHAHNAPTTLALVTLIAGQTASGPLLKLSAPISFWGGIDPRTSAVADVRHPEHGLKIAGTILYLPGTIGSSSASAVLLELIHKGIAPKAIILKEPDAILLLGVLVAREMGWATPAAYKLG